MTLLDYPVVLQEGEPHPDDEHGWKSWWVAKMFRPETPLYQDQLLWVHSCWVETEARYPQTKLL